MNSIVPTIGRKVWYWDKDQAVYSQDQAHDATVIYVWGDDLVNLRVTNHAGTTGIKTSVRLRDFREGDSHTSAHGFATWMPYQIKQVAK